MQFSKMHFDFVISYLALLKSDPGSVRFFQRFVVTSFVNLTTSFYIVFI